MTLHVHGLAFDVRMPFIKTEPNSNESPTNVPMASVSPLGHALPASMPANCPTDRNRHHCHLTNAQPQTAASAPQPPTAAVTAPIIANAALQPSCQYSCQSCTTPHPPNRRPQQRQCPTLVQHRLVMCQPNRRPQQRQ